jgi:hypothetical protein
VVTGHRVTELLGLVATDGYVRELVVRLGLDVAAVVLVEVCELVEHVHRASHLRESYGDLA